MDVAIVGGGPAGLLAATCCAEAGLDVVVVEEHAAVGEPTHCTGIVSLETAQYAKVPADIVLGRLSRARLHAPDGAAYDVAWDDDGREPILAIDRSAFDRSLARQAETAGALVWTGARVDDVVPGQDGVDVSAAGVTLRVRACVLACGTTYSFQRRLGLGLPGRFVHTAQLEATARPGDHVDLYFGRALAPEGFAWVVPVERADGGRMKVGVMARGDAGAALRRVLAREDVRRQLLGEPGPPRRRLLPLRPIVRTFSDRLLVIGDAGGFTKPTTGGGIFYSLLTASLAAETLIEGFQQGRLDAAFLGRYERRWQERLGRELGVAAWLRDVVTRLTDAEIATLLQALARDDVQAAIRGTARFNWHAEVILALVRRRELTRVLFRALLG
jgi:geranylgeranyl reductase family protein